MRGPTIISMFLMAVALFTGACSAPPKNPPSPTDANDREIERRIAKAFYTDPNAEHSRVEIRANKGEVRLTGYVLNREQRDRIHQIAASTPGVLGVSNELVLPTGKPAGKNS